MPRVGNTEKDLANRVISKTVALNAAFIELQEAEELMKVSKADSLAFRMASAAKARIVEDMKSTANSILSIHEARVTSNWSNFIMDFCANFALGFRSAASPEIAIQYDKSFGIADDSEVETK